MEDNILTVIATIISAFLLFVFPVYMAYEKKDDVSYALAMRYTQDLVDTVRSKGYITKDMYDDYIAKLKITGNSYDIKLKHEYNRYDPISNYYTDKVENGKRVYELVKTTTQEEREEIEKGYRKRIIEEGYTDENEINDKIKEYYKKEGIVKVENTYMLSKEYYDTSYIESVLNGQKNLMIYGDSNFINCEDATIEKCVCAYIMNEGDYFSIEIKNINTTLATFIYNMVTAHSLENNTRVYVNYGGKVLSTKWFGKVDYTALDYDKIIIGSHETIYSLAKELFFDTTSTPIEYVKVNYSGKNTISFDVSPSATTELREKGTLTKLSGYNFALGVDFKENNSINTGLGVSVGINGISLITVTKDLEFTTILSYPISIKGYVNVKIEINQNNNDKYIATLYIDDKKIDTSIEMTTDPRVNVIGTCTIGDKIYSSFNGYIKNVEIKR